MDKQLAYFHLPGLFEFYDLYKVFLPLYRDHREYFYDWCRIGSVYGAPADCLWGGGRVGYGDNSIEEVLALLEEYNISARLTFSNSLLSRAHLEDKRCNDLCKKLALGRVKNGVILHSKLLKDYIKVSYKDLYIVSSTTKVLTDFDKLKMELLDDDYTYVVPDFRLNKSFDKLDALADVHKQKIEFLCNECCYIGCQDRRRCYESVSKKSLGEDDGFVCQAPNGDKGYSFARAMSNPAFIGTELIRDTYLPMGFNQFKLEGRSLGSALVLEMLIYYLVKPSFQIHVREHIYLDNMLDLF